MADKKRVCEDCGHMTREPDGMPWTRCGIPMPKWYAGDLEDPSVFPLDDATNCKTFKAKGGER